MNTLVFLSVMTVAQSHPGRASPPDALFECDFESDTWFRQWGTAKPPQRTQIVLSDPNRKFESLRGRALRVRVDQGGHYGLSLTFPFRKRLGHEPQQAYFRYYLRFADDWKPKRGGKLPGFGGTYGRAGWGGRPVDGTDGWSARGLFGGQKSGRTPIGFYCYHMQMKGRYGSNWLWDPDGLGLLENNRWYCIEQYVKLNTPGQSDGVLRGWVDGKIAFEKTDSQLRAVETLRIESVWVNIYLGGTWTAESDQHLYLDEMVISNRPIGPLKEGD
jgi:hypothetical protein